MDRFKLLQFISLIVLAFTLVKPNLAKAQEVLPEEAMPARSTGLIHWGIKAGASLNQFNQSGMTIGFNGGFVFRSNVTGIFDIQAEVLYVMQGSSRGDYYKSFDDLGGPVSSAVYTNRAISLQNVSVPLLAIIKLGTVQGFMEPKVMIGGSYSYCFAAYERFDEVFYFTDGSESVAGNQTENVLSDYQQHQFDGIGGFGLDFMLSNGKIFGFEVRYHQGLNDINLFKSPRVGGALFKNSVCVNFSYVF